MKLLVGQNVIPSHVSGLLFRHFFSSVSEPGPVDHLHVANALKTGDIADPYCRG